MKMRNFAREKLQTQGYALGAFVASGSAMNCECLGINGLDFVLIDAEHAQTDMETIVELVRASELYEMSAFVRVYNNGDLSQMSRLLDIGVHGLMIPMVETAEQTKAIIDAVKFPPLGHRGANGGRGPRWGTYENYPQQANETLYTIVQCETRLGVENIHDICQIPGVDCVFIGTADLCQDLGCNATAPEVNAAIEQVLEACRQHGITPGIVAGTAESAASRIRQGFQIVTCLNDQVFFCQESEKRIRAVRQALQ